MNAPSHHLLAALFHPTPIAYANTKKKAKERKRGDAGVYVVGVVGCVISEALDLEVEQNYE